MAMLVVVGLLGLALVALIVYTSHRQQHHDAREPQVVSSRIPLLGHAIGFLTHGLDYLAQLSLTTNQPIFTLDLLLTKIYVATSPHLIPAIRQAHRTMTFEPLLIQSVQRVAGIKGPGLDLLRSDSPANPGLLHSTMQGMRPGLMGEGLDQINAQMARFVTREIDQLAARDRAGSVDLFAWCQLTITMATSAAVYGEKNPYQSAAFRRAFWYIERHVLSLMMEKIPSPTGLQARRARDLMTQEFTKYYTNHGQLTSSVLAYNRWKIQADGGASVEDIARHEVPNGLGIISNTVPACFWTLFDIYARPALVADLRAELVQNVVHTSGSRITLDLADIRAKCPLLLSSYQETLRLRSRSAQLRFIHQDTMLDDRYLLRAGSMLVVPSAAINRSKDAWGADAEQVNPRRFVLSETEMKARAPGFLSFGMAPHMCPGRYFATGEVIAVTALFLLRFDMRPVRGAWVEPRTSKGAVGVSTGLPDEAFEVVLEEREAFEGMEWSLGVTPGHGKKGLVIG